MEARGITSAAGEMGERENMGQICGKPFRRSSAIPFVSVLFLLISASAWSQTVVPGGNIRSNTNWTRAGSPYVVTGVVTVGGTGAPTLTIDAGVEVRFVSGARLVIGTTLGDGGLLVARGTASESIVFTSDAKDGVDVCRTTRS